MLLDAIFSPWILFFFLLKGGKVEGKTKNLFFFLVLTITPANPKIRQLKLRRLRRQCWSFLELNSCILMH